MILSRHTQIAVAAGVTAVLALGQGFPAQAGVGAAAPSWRVVFRHQVGPPANFSGFLAVTTLGKKNAWAFGDSHLALNRPPIAYRWQGLRWRASALPSGLSSPIVAASEPAASDVWAVGRTGYILHFNGTRWSLATKRFNGFGELTGVTAFSPAN